MKRLKYDLITLTVTVVRNVVCCGCCDAIWHDMIWLILGYCWWHLSVCLWNITRDGFIHVCVCVCVWICVCVCMCVCRCVCVCVCMHVCVWVFVWGGCRESDDVQWLLITIMMICRVMSSYSLLPLLPFPHCYSSLCL